MGNCLRSVHELRACFQPQLRERAVYSDTRVCFETGSRPLVSGTTLICIWPAILSITIYILSPELPLSSPATYIYAIYAEEYFVGAIRVKCRKGWQDWRPSGAGRNDRDFRRIRMQTLSAGKAMTPRPAG